MTEYTPTPDFYNDYIAHYGVKGMKWGKKQAVTAAGQAAYDQLSKMSPDDYQKLLARVKLVGKKGSSSKSSSSKASKSGSSEKKEKDTSSSSKSSGKSSTTSKANAKQAVKDIQERVIYKTQVDPEYTKYLERLQARKNESKLDIEDIKKRMLTKKSRAPKFVTR